MRPLEPQLDAPAAAVRAALARLRGVLGDGAVDPLAAHVERALALASFSIRPARDDPFHDVEFGSGVPVWPPGPMFPALAAVGPPLREIAGALEELQKALVFRADCSEFTDALLNRAVYLRAAGRLDLAARELAELATRLANGSDQQSTCT